jgi:2-oxoisovalerate dehydrogenase E2 component (dihydrolipoyl transacylase)
MGVRVIKLPDVGEGIAEAEVVEWHVKVGDLVKEDQVIAAVMTDKATVEIPTPVAGTVLSLGGEVGNVMAIGSELVRIDVPGAPDSAPAEPEPAPKAEAKPEPKAEAKPEVKPEPKAEPKPEPVAKAAVPAKVAAPTGKPVGLPRPLGEKPLASPAVRKRAQDAGIDLRYVRGTGPAGRILHEDIDAFAEQGGAVVAPVATGRRANPAIEEIKVMGLRRRIAQKMAESKRRVAHFSYVEEIDITALEELREAMNAPAFRRDRAKLTILPFLMRATVRAIAEFPQMNALYDDDAEVIQRFGGVHLGIATQTPSGLMVPVVRHAEARDIWDCAVEMKRLADAARDGLATREELTGSTITITSLGALGGIVTTPVINRPEVAIIGVNKMVMKPVWQNGAFVPRKTMNLSSSFDHRVIDGYDAAQFIQRIRAYLETPATIFMEA